MGEPEVDVDARPAVDRPTVDRRPDESASHDSRLQSFLDTILATTRVVIGSDDRATLLRDACSALVGHGAFVMAWIGADEDGDGWIERLAVAGDTTAYTEGLRISTADVPEGRGPTGSAIRLGRPFICLDVETDERMLPWRERMLRSGFRSAAALPLHARSLPTGSLSVYAVRPNAFGPEESRLLEDLALAIGFSLDALAQREASEAADRALRESEQRYRALVDELDAVVTVFDVATGVRYVSHQAEAMLGYPPAMLGQPGFWRSLVVPEDRERTVALWDDDAELDGYDLEYRMRRADGRVIWVEDRQRSVKGPDGRASRWHGVAMDVTRRKEAEDAEHERAAIQERLAYVTRLARDIVLLVDESGRIVDANETAVQCYGYPLETMRELSLRDLRAPHTIPAIEAQFAAAARPEGVLFETEHRRRDGSLFPVEVSSRVVTVNGRHYHQSIIRDITERRELEAQVARATRLESLGRLASGVAHDFNNLLWGVSLIADSILRNPGGREVATEASEIVAAAEKGHEMTRALLTFASGGTNERRPTDLAAFIRATIGLLERLLGPSVAVETELPAGLPEVLVDRGGLNQALINLAVNARDAMPDGGHLRIALRAVTLASSAAGVIGTTPGRFVCLSVSDTGTGITPDVLDRIFEPFFTTKPTNIGTGLGLAVTYGFLRANDGGIEVESEPGRGTTFRLYLPVAA